MSNLFYEDTVFVTDKNKKEEVFEEISDILLKKGLVTECYLNNLSEREISYPTALPLTPIDSSLPNIAVPHTESEFVNVTRLIPVKLKNPIEFKNMINPDETVIVSFLFMILNSDESEQAGLLAKIMEFINTQSVDDLKTFFNLENTNDIYKYLKDNF
ncbi:putative PTS family fructose/mannitol porter component IIA [Streptococcus pseudoporcinus]|uniref:Putative PTS family fructose/mannitol porter component IIA n=1 Tax=Streptococcus pseudoporcinus TaxID=361101 RepID=A0A4U9YEX3_9STRE|nr:PTS sugar transporter subunit IIA [Streptococcus pseudoporcinus]VTS24928.1 putative PTS family fructose/mannitol porter component IIA [Streptococcus pseudoporcinus]